MALLPPRPLPPKPPSLPALTTTTAPPPPSPTPPWPRARLCSRRSAPICRSCWATSASEGCARRSGRCMRR
eukprot:3719611-Prymnesium_polylepis.1